MTTVLSDKECRIVAHLVENELQYISQAEKNGERTDDDYTDNLNRLLDKVQP